MLLDFDPTVDQRIPVGTMSDIDDNDDSFDEFDQEFEISDNNQDATLKRLAVLTVVTTAIMASFIPIEPPRIGNSRNDRSHAIQYVRSWDDDMFHRQFRLCREDFGFLLRLISPLIQRNERKAVASSGSSICPELRLMITLQILAGAEYLDMIWYRVNVDYVSDIVLDCAHAINSTLKNINIPATEAEWIFETEQYRSVLRKKHGSIGDEILGGICAAGDGLVIQITEPVASDLLGKPSRNYMNRKGFFALLVQAFCGAYTKFWYFNVGWPGATNDIIAYKQTELFIAATYDLIPPWVPFLLDEAYSSCGGRRLSPFSQSQLR